MNYRYTLSLLLVVALFACQNDQETTSETVETDLKEVLQGTWQTTQINVAVNTVDGLDSFRAESLTEDIWVQKFRMKPPVIYFMGDQKFRKEHESQTGEMISESKGIWNTFGDTLMMIESDATYQYTVKYGNGRAAFRTFLDWDEDGEADDEYQAVYRQISIGTN